MDKSETVNITTQEIDQNKGKLNTKEKETNKRKASVSSLDNEIIPNLSVNASTSLRKENNGTRTTKKARGPENEWGLLEVLIECGISSSSLSSGDLKDDDEKEGKKKGCVLSHGVSLASLRASIHTLLKEMDKSGVDEGNCRVIEMMEEFIASGKLVTNDGNSESESDQITIVTTGQYKHALLHKMFLPMYHELDEPDIVTKDGNNVEMKGSQKCVTANEAKSFALPKRTSSSNTSLMKILLRIDALQPALLSSLFQKLTELASSQDEDDHSEEEKNFSVEEALAGQIIDEELPRLILQHIRWIDHITEPSSLATAALECLSVLSTTSCEDVGNERKSNPSRLILLDLIATLPDMVGDQDDPAQMEIIVSTLRDVRVQDPTLLIPCLDAITSLRFATEEQLENIILDALECLESVQESWLLPALCKFLMQNTPTGNTAMCQKVIETFRRLTLGNCVEEDVDDLHNGQRFYRDKDRQNHSDAEALMLEALSQGMQYRSDLTNCLLHAIKVTASSEHSAADFWLLMCCANALHNKKKVKSIIKAKAVSGAFTDGLVSDAIKGNGIALCHLFQNSVLYLADELVRATEKSARELGESIYKILFDEFPSRMQRQEIIGLLVIHAGSNSSEETDSAMKVLSSIITKQDGASSLRPFLPFLTSLLDNVQHFSPRNLRRLFLLLFHVGDDTEVKDSIMGTASNLGLGDACDDVHIVIRKHLSLPQSSMKRIGIIGAVCYAVSRSLKILSSNLIEKEVVDETAPPALAEVINMLEMTFKYCRPSNRDHTEIRLISTYCHQAPALSMFFDELCLAVQGKALACEIRGWILHRFSTDLEMFFLGDFNDISANKLMQAEEPNVDIIVDKEDKALVMGTSTNIRAPKGEMRFNIDKGDAVIYVKFLRLHASENTYTREILPQQLCPLLHLLATCHDVRYGGDGLSEIDALLGCPLLLPDKSSTGIDFTDLSSTQKWTVTACIFYAVCWCRELINSFVHSAVFQSPAVLETQSVTQIQEEMRCKIVEKLHCLIALEEDLRHVSSKCWHFTPPGKEPIAIPDDINKNSGKSNDNYILSKEAATKCPSMSASKMTDEEIKAIKDIKKAAASSEAAKVRRKQKVLKVKSKFENELVTNSFSALRPLNFNVCLALGFPELRIGNQESNCTGGSQQIILSLGASELKGLMVGGPITNILLTQLCSTLRALFMNNKPSCPRFTNKRRTSEHLQDMSISGINDYNDNPYISQLKSLSKNETKDAGNLNRRNPFLDACILGNVFSSVHEHLATVAEIRGSSSLNENYDDQRRNKFDIEHCVLLLLRIVLTIFKADDLFTSSTGRMYLEVIANQLGNGESINLSAMKENASILGLLKSIFNLFDLLEEIVMGGESDNLAFVMEGVDCLDAVLHRVIFIHALSTDLRVNNKAAQDQIKNVNALKLKVSKLCLKLIAREWHAETKFNKSNIGKLVSLYLDHSFQPYDTSTCPDNFDANHWGRIPALSKIIDEILCELPNTVGCKGPVESYPTCCYTSFGCYYSAALLTLPNELDSLFRSPLVASISCVHSSLVVLERLVVLLKLLFDLTKENPCLAKRSFLLMQLKAGTKFMENFIQRVVPFLEVHFKSHDESIMNIIQYTQQITRQLNVISAHGKREKDTNLGREAPRVRKICETFIHKMKRLMRKNGVLDAFWGGNLKSKHIDGTLVEDTTIAYEGEDSEISNEESCSDESSSDESCSGESDTESEDEVCT